jgi:hypothetical protein
MRSGFATPGELLRLHGVQFVIAANHQGDHLSVAAVHQQGLGAARRVNLQELAQLRDAARTRRRRHDERPGGGGARRGGRQRGRQFEIRRVIAAVGEHDGVLPGVGENVKFLRHVAADGAAVGLHGAEIQSHAGEYPNVGIVHGGIAALQTGFIDVKGIGILHQEFARPHHAEAGRISSRNLVWIW